mgnify:CR=1 FL=1
MPKDANGTELNAGDNVTLIKDLKVKGSSIVLKKGTKAKNIRLVDDIASLDEVIKRMANDLNLGDSYGVSDIFVEEDFSQKLKVKE